MRVLFRLYRFAKAYAGYIALSTVALVLVTAGSLAAPRLIQAMLATLTTAAASGDSAAAVKAAVPAVIGIALWLLAIYALTTVFRYINQYYSHYAAWHFVSDIRVKVYSHLQQLSVSYFSDKQTGQLLSRIISDTAAFENLIAHVVPELLGNALTFIGVTIILFLMNPLLALLTCVPLPLLALTMPLLRRIRKQHRKARAEMGALSGTLQDNLSGIKEIQAFGRQDAARDSVQARSVGHITELLRALRFSAVLQPSVAFFTALGNVIVVGFGGVFALTGHGLDVSKLVAFFLYLSLFYGPVGSIARILDDLQEGLVDGERIFELLDVKTDVPEKKNALTLTDVKGAVRFEHVDFAYNADSPVLQGIDFTVPANHFWAVVGATGVGKSTLLSLLPRFYDPMAGRVLLDGVDVADCTLQSLRAHIGIVLQDVFLFNGTLRDNIKFGNPTVNDDAMRAAAEQACIRSFIESLPEGYDTVVGERGVRLSGGQKQRIAIARALLTDARVLILDEATSAVDTETEQDIQDAILQMVGTRTLLVIAHRLSTVRRADGIVVLKEGKIADIGTYEELEKRGSIG